MSALFVTLTDSKHLFKMNLTLSWNGAIIRRGRSFGHGSAFPASFDRKSSAEFSFPVSQSDGWRQIVPGGES